MLLIIARSLKFRLVKKSKDVIVIQDVIDNALHTLPQLRLIFL